MQSPFLIGDKVYLRPLEISDAPVIVPWLNDPEVTHTLLAYRPMSLRAEEDWLSRVPRDESSLVLGVVPRSDERLVGSVGLMQIDYRNRHTGFGILIGDKPSWGKGYGTEATRLIMRHAFETLNLNRIWLHVYEYNASAIRVYEKIGFQREGVLRQENFRHGRYWDTYLMAMLREEWQAHRA